MAHSEAEMAEHADPASHAGQFEATVVIVTKNRCEELRQALRSTCEQTAPLEILVLDDGSTDGTAAMVRSDFPQVKLLRSESSLGYIAQRNRGAELAATPVIISIDDDAMFSSPATAAQTLQEFDDPLVGAVAIPFINVTFDPTVHQRAPGCDCVYVTHSYVGTAHAVRRDLFLRLGGYRESLFHQGEEGDFGLRLLEAGFVVRLGTADPIHHFESPRRDFRRLDLFGRRNDVLFAWHNVPWPYLPVHLAGVTAHGLAHGMKVRRLGRMMLGLLMGYASCLHDRAGRRPVNRSVYRLSRILKTRGPVPLAEIAPSLPPAATGS